MRNHSELSGFGKEVRLMGEVTITGEKVGADKDFWSLLAHDEALFAQVVQYVWETQRGIKHIQAPLEWGPDLGEVLENINWYLKDGWRLPTFGELCEALKSMKPDGFVNRAYYWSSTIRLTGCKGEALEVVRNYDGNIGVESLEAHSFIDPGTLQAHPRLRLCREKNLEFDRVPLEWSIDFGQVSKGNIPSMIRSQEGDGWRLPVEDELREAFQGTYSSGFTTNNFFWSSTPHCSGSGLVVICGYGGFITIANSTNQHTPSLRLCRAKK